MRREIDRYGTWPGQACSYKIGHTKIMALRTAVKTRLGAKFNLKAFHDAVLLNGSIPLTVLDRLVSEWG